MFSSTRWLAIVLASASPAVLADTTMSYRLEGKDCVPDLSVWQFTHTHMRSESRTLGMPSTVIYDHLEKLSYVLNPANRTYFMSEMDLDAADFKGDVLDSMGHQTKKSGGTHVTQDIAACLVLPTDLLQNEAPACKGGDPMIAVDPPRSWDGKRKRVDRDVGKATVSGIECTRREHLRDGSKLREDCTTSPTALKLPVEEAKLLERITRHQLAAVKMTFRESHATLADLFQRVVIVEQVCYDGDGRESGRATLQVDHAPIPPARFEVPDDYVNAMATGKAPPPRRGKH
jgi:hypothetical protein